MSDKPIRALLDTLALPAKRFGKGKARILRKLVLLAIASYADPDGTNSYPSTATIANRCLVTDRAVQKVVEWLKRHRLLRVKENAGRHRTNLYRVVLRRRAKSMKSLTPTSGEKAVRHEMEVPTHSEQFDAGPRTTEPLTRTIEVPPRNRSSDDRPIDRPLDREENRERTVPCPPSPNSDAAPLASKPSGRNGRDLEVMVQGLVNITEGVVLFRPAHKAALAKLFEEFGYEVVRQGFLNFVGRLGADARMDFVAKDFVEQGPQLLRYIQEAQRDEAALAVLIDADRRKAAIEAEQRGKEASEREAREEDEFKETLRLLTGSTESEHRQEFLEDS